MTPIVYEAHVTIEPVFGPRFEEFSMTANCYKFKAAELLLQKLRQATPERSSKDSFCTGHSKTYDDLYERMQDLIGDLKNSEFKVWRSKIEAVIYDKQEERLFSIKQPGVIA